MKLPLPTLALVGLLALPHTRAEHGNLRKFNELTGQWYGVSQTRVPNTSPTLAWTPDSSRLAFTFETANGTEIRETIASTGKSTPLATSPDPIQELCSNPSGQWFARTEKGWLTPRSQQLEPSHAPEHTDPPPRERRNRQRPNPETTRETPPPSWKSPDHQWEVALHEGKLTLRRLPSGQAREIATHQDNQSFEGPPLWAPDSSQFALWRVTDVPERQVHYIESSPKDQLQPKHFTRSYTKPGDPVDTRSPWIFSTREKTPPITTDPSLIPNPFECRNLQWRKDSKRLTFEFIERGFGIHRIIEINTATGKQRALISEESDTFIHVYGNSFRHDLNDGNEILWISERDGWKHLYLFNGLTGSLIRQLTRGEWIVREVVRVDEETREALLKISGSYRNQDPYYIHYARVSLDTGKITPLTSSNGHHDQFQRSPDGKYYTCRWSRVDHAPVTELRRWEDGSLITTLAQADDSALRATGWPLPEPFVAKDRDGKFDIHGVIYRPPNFNPNARYPVVEYIYAGPHDSFVQKTWGPWRMPIHELAVHGFIVVQIDGKGTSNRCREFHHFCYKNLRDAGFPDRIAWLKAAAARFPQLDLSRVGIFGGSAGGQNALGALLFHGDFYKAAAADCGCHDNRMDKIWWNEQWMDWPVGPHYADQSNVTHAANLKGALLLTVGEIDTNVDPSSTYQVINALIAADKDFEFLPMTGRNHGAGEDRYAQRRRTDFFLRHLGSPTLP